MSNFKTEDKTTSPSNINANEILNTNNNGNNNNSNNNNNTSSSTGQTIYNEVASYGQFLLKLGAIVGVICSIIIVAFAIYFFTRTDIYKEKVSANVLNATCQLFTQPTTKTTNEVKYSCDLTFVYVVKGESYQLTKNDIFSRKIFANETITIYVNPNDPRDIAFLRTNNKMIGGILLGVAAFVLLLSGISYYVAKKYKAAGAIASAAALVNIF
jgi:hypothetical protein